MCRVMQACECEARGQESCKETQEELEGGRNCFDIEMIKSFYVCKNLFSCIYPEVG